MSPYAESAWSWLGAGWGPLPLPAGKKFPPPKHWTGAGAAYPSGADVAAWIDEPDYESANLALRFPANVIGIDVDEYGDKHGRATLVEHTKKWGVLPRSYRITSRPDTISGIYLYRLPEVVSSAHFIGELPGGSVEILRKEHRYAVGPGSIHPEGRPYVLLGPSGDVLDIALSAEELPELPAAWVDGLTAQRIEKERTPEIELAEGRGDRYARSILDGELGLLRSIATWPIGQTDDRGRGWEKIQADVAFRLASVALADWNSLTIEQAGRAFGDAAPRGGAWTDHDVASKWRSQLNRAEPADQPATSDDPLDPGYMEPPPDVSGFEAAAGDVAERKSEPEIVDDVAVVDASGSAVSDEWVKSSLDDFGNAERLIRYSAGRLRFIESADRWMRYDEVRGAWVESVRGGQKLAQQMLSELVKLESHLHSAVPRPKGGQGKDKDKMTSDRKEFIDWAHTQRSVTKVRYAAETVKNDGALDDKMSSFDTHPMLLNVKNGVLDLETGTLRPHEPNLMLVKQAPVHFRADAPAPMWERYIADVMPTVDLQNYLQRVVGYSLTGSSVEQAIFVHQGKTQNGKSVFMKILGALMGEFARTIDPSILMSKRMEQHPTGVAGMEGRRMLLVSESAEGSRFDESLIKRLTGSDTVSARLMGRDFHDFTLVGKVHMATNHLPHISGDVAVKRRLHLVPWNVYIKPEDRDLQLEAKIIRRELEGVLAWAVRGALEWQKHGLAMPIEVEMAVDEWVSSEDEFGQFIAEELVPDDVATIPAKQVFIRYAQHCESMRQKPMSTIQFGRKLSEKGFANVHTRTGNAWKLRFRSNAPIDPLDMAR